MGLQGEGESLIRSRAVTHWTLGLIQSARAPLGLHYQTLSLGLSSTVIPCKGSTKKLLHTHVLPAFALLPFCTLMRHDLEADCLATIGSCLRVSFGENASRCFGSGRD